mmetsp:Transcript_45275/g.86585  ORF Transcript_45275/g.86585 Transcript_45275/m.86585 type:complete len:208 (-) Transcript_45275:135-758(-)
MKSLESRVIANHRNWSDHVEELHKGRIARNHKLQYEHGQHVTAMNHNMHYQGVWNTNKDVRCHEQPNKVQVNECARGTCACCPFNADKPAQRNQPRSLSFGARSPDRALRGLRPALEVDFPLTVKPATELIDDLNFTPSYPRSPTKAQAREASKLKKRQQKDTAMYFPPSPDHRVNVPNQSLAARSTMQTTLLANENKHATPRIAHD